jgi:hypothetical protein
MLRSGLRSSAPLVLVAFLGINLGVVSNHDEGGNHDWDERLAGAWTTAADRQGRMAPRFDVSCGADLGKYWPAIPDARTQPLVVLSGMSQLHTINDPRPGDQLTCQWLDDEVSMKGGRVWGLTAPNLCNEEAFFLLQALVCEPQTKPRTFLYGLCFDKFRNVDVRASYQDFFRSKSALLSALEQTARAMAEHYPAACEKVLATLHEMRSEKYVEKDDLESRLRRAASSAMPLVAKRHDVNAGMQSALFTVRNTLLGIRSSTKRPLIRSRYERNCEFVGMMTRLAQQNNVQILFYIIPLNPQADNPYVASEYQAFKQWAAEFSRRHMTPLVNIEDVVPAEHWGVFDDGPDFKHYRGEGHRLTADALLAAFPPDLLIGATALSAGAGVP